MRKTITFLLLILGALSLKAQCYTLSAIPYENDTFNGGTILPPLSDDQWSTPQQIGFPFCFYGQQYNYLLVGTNAILTFDTSQSLGYCQWPIIAAIPSSSDPLNSIMLAWHDIYPPAGGVMSIGTYGTMPNRYTVISYDSIPMYSCTNLLFTGRVILYETSNSIELYIREKNNCPWGGDYAVEGVQNQTGTQAADINGRNYPAAWSVTNDAWRLTPNCANICTALAVEENNFDQALRIFPNPSNEMLNIHFSGKLTGSSIYITDLEGRQVMQLNNLEMDQQLNIGFLEKGIYFIEIRDERSTAIAREKFVKE